MRVPGRKVPAVFREFRERQGRREVVDVAGEAFVPDPLPPELDRDRFIGRLSDDLLRAQGAMERLAGSVSSLPAPRLLLQPFRLREARLSSRIENTIASAEEIALARANRPTLRSEAREVANYVSALEHGLASELPLCNRLFCEMHAILMQGVDGQEKTPGVFRSAQVMIGDDQRGFENARFVPPPPGDVLKDCMADFERFVNGPGARPSRARDQYPAIIEIAMAHYQFEAIHPFNDGNGRLGRLLIALSLCRLGSLDSPLVYISGYFDRHRQEYYDRLLAVSTQGDWEGWVRYFCRAVEHQSKDGIQRAARLRGLRDRYMSAATQKRTSALVSRLIDHLFVSPIVNASDIVNILGVTPPTAQGYIDFLEKNLVLKEITGGRYGRLYAATEILDVVQEEQWPE